MRHRRPDSPVVWRRQGERGDGADQVRRGTPPAGRSGRAGSAVLVQGPPLPAGRGRPRRWPVRGPGGSRRRPRCLRTGPPARYRRRAGRRAQCRDRVLDPPWVRWLRQAVRPGRARRHGATLYAAPVTHGTGGVRARASRSSTRIRPCEGSGPATGAAGAPGWTWGCTRMHRARRGEEPEVRARLGSGVRRRHVETSPNAPYWLFGRR